MKEVIFVKTILISILSFIVGMFVYVYLDFANLKANGDKWTNYKKEAMKYLYN